MKNFSELNDEWLSDFREEKEGMLLGSPNFFKGGQEDGGFLTGIADFIADECPPGDFVGSEIVVAIRPDLGLPGHVATLAIVPAALKGDEMVETFMLFHAIEEEFMWWVPSQFISVKNAFSKLFEAGLAPEGEEYDAYIATWCFEEVFSIAQEWLDSYGNIDFRKCLH